MKSQQRLPRELKRVTKELAAHPGGPGLSLLRYSGSLRELRSSASHSDHSYTGGPVDLKRTISMSLG